MENSLSSPPKGPFTKWSTINPSTGEPWPRSFSIQSPVTKPLNSSSSTTPALAPITGPAKYYKPTGVPRPWTWEYATEKDAGNHTSEKATVYEQSADPTLAIRARDPKCLASVSIPLRLGTSTNPGAEVLVRPTLTKTSATATGLTAGNDKYMHKFEHEAYKTSSSASRQAPRRLLPYVQQQKLVKILAEAKPGSAAYRASMLSKRRQGVQKSTAKSDRCVEPLPFFKEEKIEYFAEKDHSELDWDDQNSDLPGNDNDDHDDDWVDYCKDMMNNTIFEEKWQIVKVAMTEGVLVEKPDMDDGEMEVVSGDWELLSVG